MDIHTPEDVPNAATARKLCEGCPVFDLCKEYADTAQPAFGVWAGQMRGKEMVWVEDDE